MREPSALPPGLPSPGFRVATARVAGVSPRRLRAGDLDSSWWGVRSSSPAPALVESCQLLAARLPPRTFYSHSTAAQIQGIPVTWRLENAKAIHVAVPAPTRAILAHRIVGHSLTIAAREIVTRDGIRMTSPARTWTDLAEQLTLVELVAAGDYLIHWRNPICTIAELAAAVRHRRSRRGLRSLTAALPHLNDRSESPPESHLRVLMALSGLPSPKINHTVSDRFGQFVARTDFLFEEGKLVVEYQGDYHRTNKGQWRADMTRRSAIEAIDGWRVMEVNADDLKTPAALMSRIRSSLGRPRPS